MSQGRRPGTEGMRQDVIGLLTQTRDYVDHMLQCIEGPAPRSSVVKKGSTVQPRKRRRSSPVQCATDRCFSAQLAFPRTPTQDLLPCLSGELRHHQLAGVKWLATLYQNNMSGILSDELQKDRQVQVVGLFAFLKNKGIGGPFLIVAGKDVVNSWSTELQLLLPQGLVVHVYNPTMQGSSDMLGLLCSGPGVGAGANPADPMTRVILVSHETFFAEQHVFRQHHFKHVVLDSCQQLATTMQSLELIHHLLYQGPRVLLLTAAHPAQKQGQSLLELWPLLRMVLPDSWEHVYSAVMNLVKQAHEAGTPTSADEVLPGIISMIQDIIDRFVLSRTQEEVDLKQQRRETKVNLYDYLHDADVSEMEGGQGGGA